MPIRLCLAPRCPAQAHYRGYCAEHARVKEQQTHRAGKAIYGTKRWKMLRRSVLFEHPLCECGCGEIATDVHHKVDLADGGDPWNRDGLQALNHACHSRITASRMRPDGKR